MNKKYILFVVATAFIILAASFLVSKSNLPLAPNFVPTPEETLRSAMLIIDYGEGDPTNFPASIDENSTAFSLLKTITEKEKITLDTQQYDFGVFVKSINGKESSAEKAWIFFVNGESGTVAADQMKVSPGDTIEWRFIKPSSE